MARPPVEHVTALQAAAIRESIRHLIKAKAISRAIIVSAHGGFDKKEDKWLQNVRSKTRLLSRSHAFETLRRILAHTHDLDGLLKSLTPDKRASLESLLYERPGELLSLFDPDAVTIVTPQGRRSLARLLALEAVKQRSESESKNNLKRLQARFESVLENAWNDSKKRKKNKTE